MPISPVRPKLAVYKLQGTLAALVKESVWHKMLNGDNVGVWEPDRDYWSLVLHGNVVESITVPHAPGASIDMSAQKAVEEFFKLSVPFKKECMEAYDKPIPGAMRRFTEKWQVRNGYPNVLFLTAENIARHRRENMDALKLANRMRDLIKNQVTMGAIRDEMKFGITREGRE